MGDARARATSASAAVRSSGLCSLPLSWSSPSSRVVLLTRHELLGAPQPSRLPACGSGTWTPWTFHDLQLQTVCKKKHSGLHASRMPGNRIAVQNVAKAKVKVKGKRGSECSRAVVFFFRALFSDCPRWSRSAYCCNTGACSAPRDACGRLARGQAAGEHILLPPGISEDLV